MAFNEQLKDYLLKLFGNQPMEPMATAANTALAMRNMPEAPEQAPTPMPPRVMAPTAPILPSIAPRAAAMPTAQNTPLESKPVVPASALQQPTNPVQSVYGSKYDDSARQQLYDSLAEKRRENASWGLIANVADMNSHIGGGTPTNAYKDMNEHQIGDEKTARADFEAGATRESNVRDYLEKQREKNQENTRQSERDRALDRYHTASLDMQKRGLDQKNAVKANVPTGAETAVDKAFAKDYSNYVAGGGFADAQSQIKDLKDVAAQLKGPSNLTGGGLSLLPDAIRARTNPKSIAAQQAVERSVQRVLRQTLGAQFTEREGQMFMQRGYDPRLSEEENSKKLAGMISQLETMANAKKEAVDYYEANGTLKGFKGNLAPSSVQPDNSSEQRKARIAQLRAELGK